MLTELRVRNFAIVEDGALSLGRGMTAFTGETGAGKSLLLDAITLLLGAKARSNLVRFGSKSAEVEGVFDVSQDPDTSRRAEELGFGFEEGQEGLLFVRREISATDGKNRIWIQGRAATRAQLQELLGGWVEISGQHEFLRLGREDYVLGVVDQFGGLREEVRDFGEAFREYDELRSELAQLETEETQRASRLDFLQFQVEEFDKAGITADVGAEEERLASLRARLGSTERIRLALDSCRSLLEGDGEGPGALASLGKVAKELRPLSAFGESFASALKCAEETESHASDLLDRTSQLLDSLEVDPEALESAEAKLSQLNRLKRKYNVDAAGLVEILEKARGELAAVQNSGPRLAALRAEIERRGQALAKSADALHSRRLKAAETMGKQWEADLRVLGMKQARFDLRVEKIDDFRLSGRSRVRALFSANAGQPPAPLEQVASGGELSRIMLALKHIVAGRSEIGVYLFDEVDSGIGGDTAHAVAARLRKIATDNQVLVVTHLAQVAAYGHVQFRISKLTEGGKTRTLVQPLAEIARPAEIARMLGGSESKAGLELAREMLVKALESTPKLKPSPVPAAKAATAKAPAKTAGANGKDKKKPAPAKGRRSEGRA
jgi:DNA repair protein RecN (Recombination protein N)